MSNRYYTDNSQRKISAEKPPIVKCSYTKPSPSKESTASWKTDLGSPGPKRNTVGFPEIKVRVKQKLADDGKKKVSRFDDKENEYDSIHGYEAKMSARISGNEDRYNKLYGGASASIVGQADSTFNYKKRNPRDKDDGPSSTEIQNLDFMRKRRR